MNLFLRAKHWQIFIFTFGIPFVFQIILMVNIFSSILQKHDPAVMFGYFKFFPLMMVVYMGALFGWLWSIGVGLQKLVPPGVQMKVIRFKVFFFIPLVYITALVFFIASFFNSDLLRGAQPDPAFFYIFPVIFPLHLFSMFCIFYCLYFVAKTLKTVELQREVTFSDFLAEFFLVWFNFVGLWILQPRINKLAGQMASPAPR
jgi:hypothetical protein